MKAIDLTKYQGIIPAFYACYDDAGEVSPERVRAFTEYLIGKKVTGVYVGGSSGECIYQSVAERKAVLEAVIEQAAGRITVIAHVACNNTRDSMELAAHAESAGADCIAAIPPIYFHLPDRAVAKYWSDIASAAPNTDFIIYNIPQLAGTGLNSSLLRTMLSVPNVIGVKNSSMPIQDIEMWRDEGAIVFNGPDEQLLSGLAAGAVGQMEVYRRDGCDAVRAHALGMGSKLHAVARVVAGDVRDDRDAPCGLGNDGLKHGFALGHGLIDALAG